MKTIKFEFDLLIVIIALVFGIAAVSQCSQKNSYKKAYNKTVVNEGIYSDIEGKVKQMVDNYNYYVNQNKILKEQLQNRDAKISKINNDFKELKNKWALYTTKEKKRFIDSLFSSTGGSDDKDTVYMLGTQVDQIGIAVLNGNECMEILPELNYKLQIINSELDVCDSTLEFERKINNDMVNIQSKLQKENQDLVVKNKVLKKKNLWKTVYGACITGLFVVVVF